MPQKRFAKMLERSVRGLIAMSFAVIGGVVPASFAQHSQGVDHGKPAGTGSDAEERRDELSDRPGPEDRKSAGVQVAVTIGRVSVGPELVDGEPIYVRRSTVKAGMTVVEFSAIPFAPDLPPGVEYSGDSALTANAKEPAGW